MLKLEFTRTKDQPLEILCLGAHSDDIEIGCGATILTLAQQYTNTQFNWVVFSSSEIRKKEVEASANAFLENAALKNVTVKNFRDGYFPYVGAEVKDYFEELGRKCSPDVIFTHYRNDLHQDHRVVSELTWNTFRDHLILEYEIPKYDGDLGHPNLFAHLTEALCNRKIEYLLRFFSSQRENHWFTEETFAALLRLRGIESNAPHRYAEAFYCRKAIVI
jgi:LmbE family N-acetylglucosaminyl deacetylase